MEREIFIPPSMVEISEKEAKEEEIYKAVFPLDFQSIENRDEMNYDNLYMINSALSNEKTQPNEFIVDDEEGLNTVILMDDYEAAFNKLSSLNQEKNIVEEEHIFIGYYNEKEDYCPPCFIKNLIPENNGASPQSNNESFEIVIKVENPNEKNKKDQNKDGNEPLEFDFNTISLLESKKSKSKQKEKTYVRGPYKKKNRIKQKVDSSNKYFPFTPGKSGLISTSPTLENSQINLPEISKDDFFSEQILQLKDLEQEEKQENNSDIYTEKDNNDIRSENNFLVFKTKRYFINEKGKKKIVKKKRKYKPDDIRKKIKSRFHKSLKNIINQNLKKAGSEKFFDFLPQSFIGNVSRELNKRALYMTYKDILSTNYLLQQNKLTDIDKIKYIRNKKVLQYLEENPDIKKMAGFNIIENMKYKEILSLYFSSSQFEDSITQLKNQEENYNYIQEYIYRAKTYIKFYEDYEDTAKLLENKMI